ncbi:MAG: AzlD domain-containing protein [Chloroflexi bacterium]|uniref:AzlD domain-containing protein n=1 Tax=Candidatus Flexifilum breve TaxID=3140694 RepID=UPI003135426B|nr:AzlD domain-containing protein [Chloroflexota bacterium]
MNEVLLVAGMALVTFLIRYPLLELVGKISLPDRLFKALRYVPPAVLAAIIVPSVIMPKGEIALSPANPFLVAGIVSALVAWRSKNLLLTVVIGMITLLAYRAIFNV